MSEALCIYCLRPAEHMDHVVPRSKGGPWGRNLVPACSRCNHAKSNMSVEMFLDGHPEVLARVRAYQVEEDVLPGVMPTGEVVTFRVSSTVIDQLDEAADTEKTTRKVIITRALQQAGFQIPPADLEDRTPRRRRNRRAA